MKAAKIVTPGKIQLAEMPMPILETAQDVIIKIRRIGICGSDIHIMHGQNPFASYPLIFGHEFVGEVYAIGEDVKELQIGDHVTCEPIEYCGHCYACANGSPNVCGQVKVRGVHIEGGAQEYIRMLQNKVFKIDKSIPWNQAILVEPLTIGAQVCMRGSVKKGDVMFIMGSGTIGLCILMIAKLMGAVCIISDIVDEKLAFAKSLGADYVINAIRQNVEEELSKITEGMGPNVVADTVCLPESLEQACKFASVAGRVVELGFLDKTAAIPMLTITKKQLSICGSRLQSYQFSKVADLVCERSLMLEGFVDKVFPFEQVAEAFTYAENNMGKYRKIVLEL